jgi:flagellar hook assembly protein FlgD
MAIAYPGDTPVPSSFELMQNYPNPFNPVTTIKYRLEESGQVRLTIYDELGREIRTLMDQRQNAGWHQVSWDGRDNVNRVVATGTYFYTLKGTSSMQAKKMILLK